mgnify:CR=1 FL=1
MTNREYYKEQILDIACNGGSISIDKMTGELFECTEELKCEDCLFHISECEDQIKKWANTEHIEKPKLTKNEKLFLSLLHERWKYMARDQNENLFIFDQRPSKDYDINMWNNTRSPYVSRVDVLIRDSFSMVKWKDENPWSIEDLKKLPVEEEEN